MIRQVTESRNGLEDWQLVEIYPLDYYVLDTFLLLFYFSTIRVFKDGKETEISVTWLHDLVFFFPIVFLTFLLFFVVQVTFEDEVQHLFVFSHPDVGLFGFPLKRTREAYDKLRRLKPPKGYPHIISERNSTIVAEPLWQPVAVSWQQNTASCLLRWQPWGVWVPQNGSSMPRSDALSSWRLGHRWKRMQQEGRGPKQIRRSHAPAKWHSPVLSPCLMLLPATTWMKVGIHTAQKVHNQKTAIFFKCFSLNAVIFRASKCKYILIQGIDTCRKLIKISETCEGRPQKYWGAMNWL